MRRRRLILYRGHEKGEINANVVGRFIKCGLTLDVIRPGYDAQGRRRLCWTQVVHDGVPIWEFKLTAPIERVLDEFETQWTKTIGRDKVLAKRAASATREARLRTWRDGVSGESPAPTVTLDGRDEGLHYVG